MKNECFGLESGTKIYYYYYYYYYYLYFFL
jgi:hypothetical protein